MARTDTLGNFLTDVADAIREKKGTSETIQASDFDTEIENLPSGEDISEYFNTVVDENTNSLNTALFRFNLKLPEITIKPNVTSLDNAFSNIRYVSELNFTPETDTSNVTNMQNLFYYCFSLKTLDLSVFSTEKVTKMLGMFQECRALTSINLSSFNTEKVTDMTSMFLDCRNLTALNLSNFITTSVTDMINLFSSCQQLEHLDIRNFAFDNVTRYNNIFNKVPANCEIIVKSQTEKDWVLARRSDFTNVKTVEEYEAE